MKTSRRAMVRKICAGALWLAVGSWAQAAELEPVKRATELIFISYDRDGAGKLAFQIHMGNNRRPTELYSLGTLVAGTPLMLSKFEFKQRFSPQTGSSEDVSEATLVHKDSGQTVVLVLGKVTNVADLLQPPPKAPK